MTKSGDFSLKRAMARKVSRQIALAVFVGCFALACVVGLFLAWDTMHVGLVILLWAVYGLALLISLIRLGGWEAGGSAFLTALAASIAMSACGVAARDGVTLITRGHEVQAVVSSERVERDAHSSAYYYVLRHRDGSRVAGPEMRSEDGKLPTGETITVYEDPEGELQPKTPGQAAPTGELIGAGASAVVALAAVGWAAWRGHRGKPAKGDRTARQTPLGRIRSTLTSESSSRVSLAQQEEDLRTLLRARKFDNRGYIRTSPDQYPDISHRRAAQICREEGLLPEAFGNKGYWRFGERVLEEAEPEG